jgi:murein DD-endopeptidase MepM/ murein hydrolase activator NlpD
LVEDQDAEAQHPADLAPRRRLLSFKRVTTASFSVGVIGVVGLLAVGMTTPVGAVAAVQGADPAASTTNVLAGSDIATTGDEDIQAYVAPADVQAGPVERTDGYEALSLAEIAADSGIQNFSSFFVNDPTSAIQWPFAVGVPITYGFGMRSGTMHEGADFVPGAGAPVQAIADGTVRIATESGGAYGVTVVIDHVIDGELVSSRYAHMQYDSLTVSPGDTVTVGTVIGKTGNTGRSYGAHTHFEILAGGTTAIDPIPWLRSHAGG